MWHTKMIMVGMAAAILALAGCGGGGGGSSSSPPGTSSGSSPGGSSGTPAVPVNSVQASRFLAQATMGASPAAVTDLTGKTVEAWLDAEFAKPQTSHLATLDAIFAVREADPNVANPFLNQDDFFQSWWTQAAKGEDQLRQRVSFALSQIFVVSFDSGLSQDFRGIAAWYDMLGRNSFGNFRTLLEDVSRSPMMGAYLSHVRNQKEDPVSGRMPDENYAREIMQLFTIGLIQLNLDGSVVVVNGKPKETYTNEDVTGLAKVFTGFSYGGPDTSRLRFFDNAGKRAADSRVIPMQAYKEFHSTSAKTFLGRTIPASTTSDPDADLKIALDVLFNHPNVGPFIGKQLIQRLVTSNPSPAYVSRVASAFNNNGKGERGDMKAVIRAVLLDDEARDRNATYSTAPSFGKVREPVLRLTNWMRAFNASSPSGDFRVGSTDSTATSLGMSPMRSPSVFNFYRPGYVASNSQTGAQGLVAPELQITQETSVAGYLNLMQSVVQSGIGAFAAVRATSTYSDELALADTPAALVDRVLLHLNAGVMSTANRQRIINAVTAISIPTTNANAAATARRNRVYLAVFLAMASPDYIVQK